MKKKRTIWINVPPELQTLCDITGQQPADVVNGYLNNLLNLPGNNGSDERALSKEFYLRCSPTVEDLETATRLFNRLPANVADNATRLYHVNLIRKLFKLRPLRTMQGGYIRKKQTV